MSWFGAIQAQDYLAAKWAVGLRLKKATDASVERAIDDGDIVRIHAMRGTWQLIAPEDVRWILSLVKPRLRTFFARAHRHLELDAAMLKRSCRAIAAALEERDLTRSELARALRRGRVAPEGLQLSFLLMNAELEGVICGGARRGKENLYTLLDRRAPKSRKLDRHAAIEELARRYFQSRSPATAADFAWWAGLSLSDARSGLEAVQPASMRAARSPSTHLLPSFDEYLIAYKVRDDVLNPKHTKRINAGGGMFAPLLVVDGRVVGTWKRTLSKSSVAIRIEMLEKVKLSGVEGAVERYASFLGLPPVLEMRA